MEPTDPTASAGLYFQINSRLQVVDWPEEVARALGVSAGEALGKTCYDLVGPAARGRPACRSCPVCSRADSAIPWRNNCPSQGCRALPLPGPTGGALVHLSGEQQFQQAARRHLEDLATIGYVATVLTPRALHRTLEEAVDILRQVTESDGMEIFVRRTRDAGLLQLLYRGSHPDAFCQQVEFQPGQGFPGLVVANKIPLVTDHLESDERFLRSAVKAHGIRAYACVPLTDGSNVFGSLQAAWKNADAPLERATRLLTWASNPISTAILAHQAWLSQAVELERLGARARTLERYLHSVLDTMRAVSRAHSGTLVWFDPRSRRVCRRVSSGEEPGPDCQGLTGDPCRLLLGDGPPLVVPGRPGDRSSPCRQVTFPARCHVCVPLRDRSELRGCALLSFADASSQVTRYLTSLAMLAEECVLQVKSGWSEPEAGSPEPSRVAVKSVEADHDVVGPPECRLEAVCFGRFQLFREGRRIPDEWFRRTAALRLLKILLLQGERPISRDALCDLLWPGVGPRTGANRLHGVVHALREVLEPYASERRWLFIKNRPGEYFFDPTSPNQVDLHDFRRLAARGAKLRAEDPDQAIACFEQAVSLYRGDLFEDEPYADWCWTDREHLREDYLAMLKSLAHLWTQRHDLDRSVEYYRRALDVDPLREDLHQGLIETLWRQGRRKEALDQYERCAATILRELDCPPLPRTRRLYLAILENPDGPGV